MSRFEAARKPPWVFVKTQQWPTNGRNRPVLLGDATPLRLLSTDEGLEQALRELVRIEQRIPA